jgi:6-phospho-beta-glucosidase
MEKRYGFVFTDFDDHCQGTGNLYRKKSFAWYKKVIETRGASLTED